MTVPGVSGSGGVQTSTELGRPCFPEWYQNNMAFLTDADALGIVDLNATSAGNVPAGITIVLQRATQKSGIHALSLPITMQF